MNKLRRIEVEADCFAAIVDTTEVLTVWPHSNDGKYWFGPFDGMPAALSGSEIIQICEGICDFIRKDQLRREEQNNG